MSSSDMIYCARASDTDKSADWAWLSMAIAILVLGRLLQVCVDGSVTLVFLPGVPLPTICLFRRLFFEDCMTCGLTRSIIHLMHGQIGPSLESHLLGWLFWMLIAGQIPYRLWRLSVSDLRDESRELRDKRLDANRSHFKHLKHAFWPVLVSLLVLNRFLG